MLTIKDVIISSHKETKLREFYVTLKCKEEDINLNGKEFLREACRNGLPFDVTFNPGADSTPIS